MWKVALRGLLAHKARVVLTVLAVLMGVAFITAVYILTDSTKAGFDKLFSTVNAGIDFEVRTKPPVGEEQSPVAGESEPIAASVIGDIKSVPGVVAVDGLVFRLGIAVIDEQNKEIPFFGPSIATNYPSRLDLSPYSIRVGVRPASDKEVLVDTATFDSGKLALGDSIDVIFPNDYGRRTYKIVGTLGFGEAEDFSGAQVVMFTGDEAQRAFDIADKFDALAVATDQSIAVQEMRERIRNVLPPGVEVRSGEEVTAEQKSSLSGFIGVFATILLAFGFVGVFVAAFLIVNTFSIIVSQRVRELALLRALGASSRQVISSVMLEALVLGTVASFAGLGVGYLAGKGLKDLTARIGFDPGGTGAVLLGRTVVVAFAIGIGVTALAALVPAWKASRTSPLAAVRDVESVTGVLGIRRTVVGIALLVAGISALFWGSSLGTSDGFLIAGGGALGIFVGAIMLTPWLAAPAGRILGAPFKAFGGITGSVARANLRRNPRRTGITASALMIGLALVTAVVVLTASVIGSVDKIIDDSIASDLSVSRDIGPFSTAVRDVVAELPEVGLISAYRASQVATVAGKGASIEAIEPQAVDTLLRLNVVGYDATSFTNGGLLVSEKRAEEHSWSVGDVVPAVLGSAGSMQLTISGIYRQQGFFEEYLVSIETFEASFEQQRDWFVFVGSAEGVSLKDAKAAIEAAVEDEFPYVRVQDREELKSQQRQQMMLFLAFFVGLLLITLVISLLGILNTLALSILERTREIGLLRAVGAHRRQIRQMVRWEAVMIATLGGILGVVIGLALGVALTRALVEFQITELVIPWLGLCLVLLVAVSAGLFAAIYPAWRASRLDVLKAVATE